VPARQIECDHRFRGQHPHGIDHHVVLLAYGLAAFTARTHQEPDGFLSTVFVAARDFRGPLKSGEVFNLCLACGHGHRASILARLLGVNPEAEVLLVGRLRQVLDRTVGHDASAGKLTGCALEGGGGGLSDAVELTALHPGCAVDLVQS